MNNVETAAGIISRIGDAVAIAATAVIWTCIFGFIFLKEKLHWLDLAMIPVRVFHHDPSCFRMILHVSA